MICIAGMPRTGSSLLTQLLHRCGLSLGPSAHLMPASINNTDGFWENLRFVRLNERLLTSSGGTWYAPPAKLRPTPRLLEDARAIVGSFAGQEPWGWKDPRNAITLSFWKSLVPRMRVLVCLRHPMESASSLVASTLLPHSWRMIWNVTRESSAIQLQEEATSLTARMRLALRTSASTQRRRALIHEIGLELWRVYNTSILEQTRVEDRMVTHYDAVLANPHEELQRIVTWAGIPTTPDGIADAVSVVSPRLRHQRVAEPLAPHLQTLYQQLSAEALVRS